MLNRKYINRSDCVKLIVHEETCHRRGKERKREREREDDTRHTEMSRGMLGPLTGGCGTITLCTITMAWLTVPSDVLNLTNIYYCRQEDLMNQCLRRFYTHSTD